MAADAKCTLRVVRRSQFADRLRSYKIFVNGSQVGTVARNSTLDLEVPSGPLTIEARLDWGRSHPLNITTTPHQKIEIEVSNRWNALLAIWAITFGSRDYLTLKQLPV